MYACTYMYVYMYLYKSLYIKCINVYIIYSIYNDGIFFYFIFSLFSAIFKARLFEIKEAKKGHFIKISKEENKIF